MNATLPPASELLPRLELARSAAREAGLITLQYFQRRDVGFERKADASPVTIADRQAEELLRKRIAEKFPGDAILGEEFAAVEGKSGFRWILDPIDGTKSFISGVPLYSTLIGVEWEGRAVIGLIRIPALDECVYAAVGNGAWYEKGDAPPVAARVSDRKLDNGLLLASQIDSFAKRGAAEAWSALEKQAYVARTWGDGYGYLLIATGRAEVMIDPIMNVWDAAALQPVMEESGGTFTDWNGSPTIHSGEGIGTNGVNLAAVLAVTKNFAKK